MQRNALSYIDHLRTGLLAFGMLMTGCLIGFHPVETQAQGTAQVIVNGIPPFLPSPSISDLERSYQQGLFTTQFIFVSPSRQPRTFRFRLTLDINGETVIDMTSEPNQYEPGIHIYRTFDDDPRIVFPLTYAEWVGLLGDRVDETGILPEGDYTLTIEPILAEEDVLIPTLPGIAFFTVRYEEPPILLTPLDRSNLTTQFPIFSWTPIAATPPGSTIEYELIIAEVLPGQAPYQALESNRELVRDVLVGQTSFVYTQEKLPLEKGKTYVWQVRAYDLAERVPILDRGETEFYTFTVGAEGLGSMLTSWSFPVSSPFLIYPFDENADIEPSDTEIYIDGLLPIQLNGLNSEARFDRLLIDAETQTIIEGAFYLQESLALEIAINTLSDHLSDYSLVPAGSLLRLDDGILLEIGNDIRIDGQGMHPRGTHRAVISYTGIPSTEYTATFSEDLTIDFSPFSVTEGRIDIASEGVARAYIDPAGIHLIDLGDPVVAQVPDRLLLPGEDLAYVPLKRAGTLLVDIQETEKGRFRLSRRPGAALELVLPALQDPLQGQAPHFPVTLNDVVVEAATGQLVSGSIEAPVPASESFTLDPIGIPIAPTSFSAQRVGGALQLGIEGSLTLFARPLRDTDPIKLTISEDRVVSGLIDIQDAEGTVLLDDSGYVRLDVASAVGAMRIPLRDRRAPTISLDVAGRFGIFADSALAASANLAFRYKGEGPIELMHFAPGEPDTTRPYIAFAESALAIRSVEGLSMSYTASQGLRYAADVQSSLILRPGGALLSLPLRQVELREDGFVIPRQELHEGIAEFEPARFSTGPASLRLLAMRMPATHVNWFAEGRAVTLTPSLDFEVHLTGFENRAPLLGAVPLTLQDASIRDGYLAGSLVPYRLTRTQLIWNFDAGTMHIDAIQGSFSPSVSGQQLTLQTGGEFSLRAPVADGIEACSVPDFTLTYDTGHGFDGASAPFTPCHAYSVGPLAAQFRNDAVMRVASVDRKPRFSLEGSVAAIRSRSASTVPQGTGTLALDLVSGELIDADLNVQQLVWVFPQEAPRYRFEIDEAHLTADGFAFTGDSTTTAILLSDDSRFRFSAPDSFRLGIDPTHRNAGSGELVGLNNPSRRGGRFDARGFHESANLPASIVRIDLPGGHGAYLQLEGAPGEALNLKHNDSAGTYTASTKNTAMLVLPLLGTTGTTRSSPEIPVSFEIALNDGLAYVSGSFDEDLSEDPVDLTALGYPIFVTGISYDDQQPVDERLRLKADVLLPTQITGPTESGMLPVEFLVRPGGLEAVSMSEQDYSLYEGNLTIDFDHASLSRGRSNRQPLLLAGAIDSPILGHARHGSAPLRFTAWYNYLATRWEFQLDEVPGGQIGLGKGTLVLDPNVRPVLKDDPALGLELAGLLHFPTSIGDDFALGIALEIGPGGLFAWSTGSIESRRSLFDGFLDLYLDAADVSYDAAREAVVATLDGAFAPHLVRATSSARSRSGPSDLLPFSGLTFGTDGLASRLRAPSNTLALDLMDRLPPLPLIDQAFSINGLQLSSTVDGLFLNLLGYVRLPERSSVGTAFTNPIPVSIGIDSKGRLFGSEGKPWRSTVSIPVSSSASQTQPLAFSYHTVQVDFDPAHPDASRLYASGRISVRTHPLSATSDSLGLAADSVAQVLSSPVHPIALGNRLNARRHPGLIVQQHQPQHYLLTDSPSEERPLFTLEAPLADIRITSLALPDPERLVVELAGQAALAAEGFSGRFPIEHISLDTRGIRSLGESAHPAVLAFNDAAAFEVGCFDYRHQNLSSRPISNARGNRSAQASSSRSDAARLPVIAQLQFGDACGARPNLTLTDRWFAGSYARLTILDDGFTPFQARIESANVQIGNLATLQARFTYEAGEIEPRLQIEGNTRFEGIGLPSEGSLHTVAGAPGLSLRFSPADRPLTILPDAAQAAVSGGGLFLRPTPADLERVDPGSNDDSENASVFANSNAESAMQADRPAILLPIELTLRTAQNTTDISAAGLFTATPQFTYLDVEGAFNGQPEELAADFFLVRRPGADSLPTLEGLANINLNYSAVLGGTIYTNFSARRDSNRNYTWSSYGRSPIRVTDAIDLPGRFLITARGLIADLHDTRDLQAGPIAVANNLNVTMWQDRPSGELGGYTAFDADVDLIPGFTMATTRLYGGLLEDREEYLLYAVNNIYADIPFVYTGPIDPWFSLQDGVSYGGDARNNTFLRMMVEARQSSNNVPQLAREATRALRKALATQQDISNDLIQTGSISFFARPDSLLKLDAERMLDQEAGGSNEDVPATIRTLAEQLFEDDAHPDYGQFPGHAAQTLAAMNAWQEMTAAIGKAGKSAEADIYTFESLAPRPLTWSAAPVEIATEVQTSPLRSISWPLEASETPPSFDIDLNASRLQRSSLLSFKQSNEALDVQFLRAITGLELNLVNLKISRSPEHGVDFSRATSSIARFQARQLADDWALLDWTRSKRNWLAEQEAAIDRTVRESVRNHASRDDATAAMRAITLQRYRTIEKMSRNTGWQRDDLPDDQSYEQYLAGLEGSSLEAEFQTTARDLWFDVPLAALSALNDTLTALTASRGERYQASIDSMSAANGAFSRALDPLYDTQTRFTTTLYGMAEEYRTWRSSIRRLDPQAVNFAFQFLPYRGNYRILAEDLAPPEIEAIKVSPASEDYFNSTLVTWTAEHPVEIAEASLAISQDTAQAIRFASVASSGEYRFYTAKTDSATIDRSVQVTLRVRGAGGVPAVKKGRFRVPVDPRSTVEDLPEETSLIPTDTTPPPTPEIVDLAYSSYFSETPNSLQFQIGALRDTESGIDRVEYRITNDRDENEVLQDWTLLQKSTEYFSGRLIETGLPVQEQDVTIRVTVRAVNGAGLQTESYQTMALDLDDSPPAVSLAAMTYFNAFDIEHPHSLRVEINNIQDQQSGIDRVEYAFQRDPQANIANAAWRELDLVSDRQTETGAQYVYISLQNEQLTQERTNLALFLRVTNGAGLQTVVNRTLDLPGADRTPPTEPTIALAHSGFYNAAAPNQLRVILSGSQDMESGIGRVEYRVLDGQTGVALYDWDDFTLLNSNIPTYILPASENVLPLPRFSNSRPIIVEARATNRAGLTSNKAVRFLQLELDNTPPTEPSIDVTYTPPADPLHPNQLQLEIGRSEDPESQIADVAYRIIDPGSQRVLTDWQTLVEGRTPHAVFSGMATYLEAPILPARVASELQVRLTNRQGLSTIVGKSVAITHDITPPSEPSLSLRYEAASQGADEPLVFIDLGQSTDPQSRIAHVRYRIRDPRHTESPLVDWTDIPLRNALGHFEGRQISRSLPARQDAASLIVDAEIKNGIGLVTTVSGMVDVRPPRTAGASTLPAPALDLYYFAPANTIRPSELELTLTPRNGAPIAVDSVRYRLTLQDGRGNPVDAPGTARWRLLSSDPEFLQNTRTAYIDVPSIERSGSARVEIRIHPDAGQVVEISRTLPVGRALDFTPPTMPAVEAVYYGNYHPEKTNQLDLLVDAIEDPESRVARVAYRVVDQADTSTAFVEWTDLQSVLDSGRFEPAYASIQLPDFSENITLLIEVAATNGMGLRQTASVSSPVFVDTTPPAMEEPGLTLSDLYGPSPAVFLDPGKILDEESNVTSVEYRMLLERDTTLIRDWTSIDSVRTHMVRAPALAVPLGSYRQDRVLRAEVRATNEAGLFRTMAKTIELDVDNSAPQMPQIDLTYSNSPLGVGYLRIAPGAFRDAESLIDSIEYRIVDAGRSDFVLLDWAPVPVVPEIRVSVDPIAVPRSKIPFDGARRVAVEMRAANRAGLSDVRRATIDLPGDATPPERPTFIVTHRNAYDPINPNSLELQIGSSADDQSAIVDARFRILEPSTGRVFADWSALLVSSEGFFPGTVRIVELPFLQNSTTLRVDLEIENTAGLVTSLSETVRVNVENDNSPPQAAIALHYFSDAMALVVERLADPESKVQQVEYRFLDNVDQTELMTWTDLFEIPIPQNSFPKQSFNVSRPEVRTGRTLKVEIRVTNGAGLQTTVSRTVLFRQEETGQ